MLELDRHLALGNVACAEVVLNAGCRLFAGYPMTPASETMVSDHEINDLQFEMNDIPLLLSLPAYGKYIGKAKKGSLVFVNSSAIEHVDGGVRDDVELIQVPARDTSVRLGNQIVANMVMHGALSKRSEMVRLDLLKEAVELNIRPSMREINLRALEEGHDST